VSPIAPRLPASPLLLGGLLAGLLLGGCPDPNAGPAPMGPGAGMAPPSDGAPGPAQPNASAGGEAGDGAGGGTAPTPRGNWNASAEEGVTLSGTLHYAGSKEGAVRVDFLNSAQMGGLQATLPLDKLGTWSIVAPKDAGPIYVVAFIDVDRDGPTASDPAGMTKDPVQIGGKAIDGIEITLLDAPDLGEFTPQEGPHPMTQPGADGAPEGAAAPSDAPPQGAVPPDGSAPQGAAPADGSALPPG